MSKNAGLKCSHVLEEFASEGDGPIMVLLSMDKGPGAVM